MEQPISRREFLKGSLAAVASVIPEISKAEEMSEDFLNARSWLVKYKSYLSQLLNWYADSKEDNPEILRLMYEKSNEYGKLFREFEDKYPKGSDPFAQEESNKRRRELTDWVKNNPEKSYEDKAVKLEEIIQKEFAEGKLDLNNKQVMDAARNFYHGFFCGYVDDLCPPTN